jgi:hypothetical protein
MFIELYIKGALQKRQFIDLPPDDPTLSFAQRIEEKERIVKRVVMNFKVNTIKDYQIQRRHFEIMVVFGSKMNRKEEMQEEIKVPVTHKVERKAYVVDRPRIELVEPEPVKFVRPKAEYSNRRLYADV